MNARVLGVAALLLGSAAAPAQLTCTPAHLRAGSELRIVSPGAFGASPSGGVSLTYRNTAGGVATRFGAARSWSAGEVSFLLPADFPPGTYEVVLSSPAGAALRNPSCFTVDPPIVAAPLAPRTAAAGRVVPTVRAASAADPCTIAVTVRVSGAFFPVGNGVDFELMADGPVPPRGWASYRYGGTTIRSDAHLEVYVFACFLSLPRPRIRFKFPDGTVSAWVNIDLDHFHTPLEPS